MKMIVLSIKPKYVEKIKIKIKSHEYRNCLPKKLPDYILIYETLPVGEIKYIIEVGKPLETKQIFNESALKNSYKYGYPILHMYKLPMAIPLAELKSKYSFNAPQGFVYISKYEQLKKRVEDDLGKSLKLF